MAEIVRFVNPGAPLGGDGTTSRITIQHNLDSADAVDKGGGEVGLPITGHALSAGFEVTIFGTTNYNGAGQTINSVTANEIVITATFVGETFSAGPTVDDDNVAYVSLSVWEAAEETDLVSDGNTHVVKCAGSTADTTAAVLTGWTTGVSNFITIKGDRDQSDGFNNGTLQYDTSFYHLEASVTICLNMVQDFTVIDGIQVKNTASGNNKEGIRTGADFEEVLNCRVVNVNSGTNRHGIRVRAALASGQTAKVNNCIVAGWVGTTATGIFVDMSSGRVGTVNVYNNTIYDCNRGVFDGNANASATTVAKNNCVFNNIDDFGTVATGTFTLDFNASDDGDGGNPVDISPGGTETDDWADAMEDPNNGTADSRDVRLKTTGVLEAAGEDSTTDSEVPATDIVGTTRDTSTPDIGAWEIIGLVTQTVAATAACAADIGRTTFTNLAATAADIALLVRRSFRTLAATAAGIAALTAFKAVFQTLAATAAGLASLQRLTLKTAFAATAAGVAGLVRTTFKTLTATAAGIAALTAQKLGALVTQTLAATAACVSVMKRTTFKTLDATALASLVLEACKDIVGLDSDFANVVLLTHMEADPPVDKSSSAHTITVGSGASLNTVNRKFGSASFDLDGGTSASLEVADHADWNFGSGEFTVEGWFRFDSSSDFKTLFSQWGTSQHSWLLHWDTSGGEKLTWFVSTTGSNTITIVSSTGFTPILGVWHHIAVARDSGDTLRIFADGDEKASASDANTYHDSTSALRLGSRTDLSTENFDGQIDDMRITKGVARYTGDFPPPACPFPDNGLFAQALAATAKGIAGLTKAFFVALVAIAAVIAALGTTKIATVILAATVAGIALMQRTTLKILRAVAACVAALTSIGGVVRQTLAATAAGIAKLQRKTFTTLRAVMDGIATLASTGEVIRQTLAATAAVIAAVVRAHPQTLAATVAGIAGLATDHLIGGVKIVLKTLAATAAGIAGMVRAHPQTLAATLVGTATLATDFFKEVALAATAACVALIKRLTLLTVFAATAAGVAGHVRALVIILVATAIGTATLATAKFKEVALAATAAVIAGLVRMTLKPLAAIAEDIANLFQTKFKFVSKFIGHGGLGIIDGATRWKRRASSWRRRR